MSQLLVDDIVNKDDTGAPGLSKGVVVTGIASVGTAVTIYGSTGIVSATTYYGDGSQLTGISVDTTALKDSNDAVRVQANTSGAVVTGVLTATSFSGDGSNLTFAPKVISFDPQALSTGVVIDKTITITFDQDISFSGTGKVELRSGSSSGTVLFEFDIDNGTPDAGLSISGTQLIINPASDLPNNTVVYVVLPSTGIVNSVGTAYAGSSTYFFQTVVETFSAQGGVEYVLQDGSIPTGYRKYHIFETSGILTTTSPVANGSSLQLLAVGGGGGGGVRTPNTAIAPNQAGGGGGAGGYVVHTEANLVLAAGTHTVTIGAGGTGGNHEPVNDPHWRREGEPGEDTTITPPASPTTYLLRAYGGGGGGGEENPMGVGGGDGTGQSGGSGGGGAAPKEGPQTSPLDGGGAVAGQGYAGSIGVSIKGLVNPTPEDGLSSGGGGGAGGAGSDGTFAGRYWRPAGSTGNDPYPYVNGGSGGPAATNSQFTSPLLTNSGLPADKLSVIGPNGYYAAGGGGVGSGSPVAQGGKGGVGGGGNGCNITGPLPTPAQPEPANVAPSPRPSSPAGDTWADATGIGCGGGGGSTGGNQRGGRGTDGILMISYETPAP